MAVSPRKSKAPGPEPAAARLAGSPAPRPAFSAATLAGGYLLVGLLYIWISDSLAAGAANTAEELHYWELLKGSVFVVVTAGLLFLVSWLLIRKLETSHLVLADQREAMVIADRRAMAGVMASSVAHDVNNVLTMVLHELDRLGRLQELGPEGREACGNLEQAAEHLKDLVRLLTDVGRRSSVHDRTQLDLALFAGRALQLASTHRRIRTCRTELVTEFPVSIFASPVVVEQMLFNLLLNAAEATGGQGHIQVRLTRRGVCQALEVHDNGPGVPPERRAELADPFRSAKHGRAGLGLVSVKACAEACAGHVVIEDSPLGGACFRIVLPPPLSDGMSVPGRGAARPSTVGPRRHQEAASGRLPPAAGSVEESGQVLR